MGLKVTCSVCDNTRPGTLGMCSSSLMGWGWKRMWIEKTGFYLELIDARNII